MKKSFQIIALILLVGMAQSYLLTHFNSDFLPTEFFLALGFLAFGLLLGLIVLLFNVFEKEGEKYSGIWIMLIFIAGFTIGIISSRYQEAQRKEDAELIINKLEMFFHAEGYFPSELIYLEPNFLNEVPTCNWGFSRLNYEYRSTKLETSFELGYKSGNGSSWKYHRGGNWHHLD